MLLMRNDMAPLLPPAGWADTGQKRRGAQGRQRLIYIPAQPASALRAKDGPARSRLNTICATGAMLARATTSLMRGLPDTGSRQIKTAAHIPRAFRVMDWLAATSQATKSKSVT